MQHYLLYSVWQLSEYFASPEQQVIFVRPLTAVLSAVDRPPPVYSCRGQQDAHEFLIFVLNQLHNQVRPTVTRPKFNGAGQRVGEGAGARGGIRSFWFLLFLLFLFRTLVPQLGTSSAADIVTCSGFWCLQMQLESAGPSVAEPTSIIHKVVEPPGPKINMPAWVFCESCCADLEFWVNVGLPRCTALGC